DAAVDRGRIRGDVRDHERHIPVLPADRSCRVVLRLRARLAGDRGGFLRRLADDGVLFGAGGPRHDPVRRDAERPYRCARRADHSLVAADDHWAGHHLAIGVIGIRFSARSDLVLLTFEIGVLLALALTILVSGAPGGDWHARVFNPGVAPGGLGGVAVGAV